MATYPSLLLLSIFFVVITSQAYGYIINGTYIDEIRVNGRLVCSIPDLLRNPGAPIVDINVIPNAGIDIVGELLVNAYTVNLAVGRAVTNSDGYFQIDVYGNVLSTLPFGAEHFSVNVQLPVPGCPIFGNTGSIQSPIRFLGVIYDPGNIIGLFGMPV